MFTQDGELRISNRELKQGREACCGMDKGLMHLKQRIETVGAGAAGLGAVLCISNRELKLTAVIATVAIVVVLASISNRELKQITRRNRRRAACVVHLKQRIETQSSSTPPPPCRPLCISNRELKLQERLNEIAEALNVHLKQRIETRYLDVDPLAPQKHSISNRELKQGPTGQPLDKPTFTSISNRELKPVSLPAGLVCQAGWLASQTEN